MSSYRVAFVCALFCLGSNLARGEEPSVGASQWSDLAVASDSPVVPCQFDDGMGSLCDGCRHWYDELTLFAGIDGSKQPQDFGVNANLGGQLNFNLGIPLSDAYSLGVQIGNSVVASDNAVRVYDLVGEETHRLQNFTTIGAFQRLDNGLAWGAVYDFLYQDSFDSVNLAQWRVRGSYDLGDRDQVGVTAHMRDKDDVATFGASTDVVLRPITQGSFFWRHWWQTGTQTTAWFGMSEEHGEHNLALGPPSDRDESFLFGADFLAPLNSHLALYGETNLIFPADSGTVDAFLGVQFYPGGNAKWARRGMFSPLLPVAAPTSFSVDLVQ